MLPNRQKELTVFLHGFLGNRNDWASVVKQCKTPSLCLDLPGHGEAPLDFAWEEALLKVAPFHLVGYSMGGRLALQFAQKHPLLSLTLISTHLGLTSETERQERRQKEAFWMQRLDSLSIDQFVQEWYDQPLFKTLKQKKKEIAQMRKTQNKQGLIQALQQFSLAEQPSYSIPTNTTLVVGEWDTAYRQMYAPYPHIVIPQSGHAIHLENPTDLARVFACKQ